MKPYRNSASSVCPLWRANYTDGGLVFKAVLFLGGRLTSNFVMKWYRDRLALQQAEAQHNLDRILATLRQLGIFALQATPERLAEAKRKAAEMRATFHHFKFLRVETQAEYEANQAACWHVWEQTYRLSILGDYDLDDPC